MQLAVTVTYRAKCYKKVLFNSSKTGQLTDGEASVRLRCRLLPPAADLHERDEQGAELVVVVVGVLQHDPELRVLAERVQEVPATAGSRTWDTDPTRDQ